MNIMTRNFSFSVISIIKMFFTNELQYLILHPLSHLCPPPKFLSKLMLLSLFLLIYENNKANDLKSDKYFSNVRVYIYNFNTLSRELKSITKKAIFISYIYRYSLEIIIFIYQKFLKKYFMWTQISTLYQHAWVMITIL